MRPGASPGPAEAEGVVLAAPPSGGCGLRFLLLTQGIDDASGLGRLRGEGVGSLVELGLHRADRLGEQDLAGLEVGELGDLVAAVSGFPSRTPPLMTSGEWALAKSRRPLAASTGSPVTKAMAEGP